MASSSTLPSVDGKRAASEEELRTLLRTVRRCPQCGDYLIGTPILQCSHGQILPLRCFWYRKQKNIYAECLDLDIITRGDTPEEAIARLQEDVYWYIATVLSKESSEGLIPRPAPWSSWARYYLHTIVCRLRSLFSKHDKRSDHHITSLGAIKLSRC